MLLIKAQNIKKHYADQLIVEVDDLAIYQGDKIGIIGLNGAGKTTLLNILSGESEADEGVIKRFCEIAYLKQFKQEPMHFTDEKLLKEMRVQEKAEQSNVSGGESTRLKIAETFSQERMLLFADEPTANLDAEGIEQLTQKLMQTESLLLISHDRNLLDRVCNTIIEIEQGKLAFYPGNYTAYAQQKKERIERDWFEYEQYQEEKTRLKDSVAERAQKAGAMKKAPSRMGNSEARLHKREAADRKKKVQSAANGIQTRIEKLDVKQKPQENPVIRLDFSLTDPPANKVVIEGDRLCLGFGGLVLLQNASFRLQNGKKTALVGQNGTGKSTLLNQIYRGNKAIRTVPKADLGYFCQAFENLEENKTILENVMRESVQSPTTARTILARLLIGGDAVHKRVSVLSGGEKNKVSFAKLFVSRANVLLLDEPTNYLDIPSVEVLQALLCEYEGTVLFVSHDSAFVNAVADGLMLIQDKKIIEFAGNLEQYENSRRQKQESRQDSVLQEMMIRMRMTQILAEMPKLPEAQREKLEGDYQQLQADLRKISLEKN